MTDLDKFIELYKSVGIRFDLQKVDDEVWIKLDSSNVSWEGGWLHSTFCFNKEGQFIRQEINE
jgi:hypothetical protein